MIQTSKLWEIGVILCMYVTSKIVLISVITECGGELFVMFDLNCLSAVRCIVPFANLAPILKHWSQWSRHIRFIRLLIFVVACWHWFESDLLIWALEWFYKSNLNASKKFKRAQDLIIFEYLRINTILYTIAMVVCTLQLNNSVI